MRHIEQISFCAARADDQFLTAAVLEEHFGVDQFQAVKRAEERTRQDEKARTSAVFGLVVTESCVAPSGSPAVGLASSRSRGAKPGPAETLNRRGSLELPSAPFLFGERDHA